MNTNPLMNLLGSAPNSNFNMSDLMNLISAAKNGNPAQAIQSLAANNPQITEILGLLQNAAPQNYEAICRKFCEQKGIDFNQAYNQFRNLFGRM